MSIHFFENEFGHSPFIGKGGLGYHQYNKFALRGAGFDYDFDTEEVTSFTRDEFPTLSSMSEIELKERYNENKILLDMLKKDLLRTPRTFTHSDVFDIDRDVQEENNEIKHILQEFENEKIERINKERERNTIINNMDMLMKRLEKDDAKLKKAEEEANKQWEELKNTKFKTPEQEEQERIAYRNMKLDNINKKRIERAEKEMLKKTNDFLKTLPETYYSNEEGKVELKKRLLKEWRHRLEENKKNPKNPPYNQDELGYGKIWEKILADDLNNKRRLGYSTDLGSSDIVSNDKHPFYKNITTPVKKNGVWINSPVSDYLPYDNSGEKQDIENKEYTTINKSYKDLKEGNDSLQLQISKFGGYEPTKKNNRFIPLFSEINGHKKLYNIYDPDRNRWINKDDNKDLYVSYMLNDGIFNLKLNDDKNFKFIDVPITGKKGEKLYMYDIDDIKNKYKYNSNEKVIEIPYTFLRKYRVNK